jgi:hypothetical protein
MKKLVAILTIAAIPAALTAQSPAKPPLHLKSSVPMPGIKGDFDHFAADVESDRLYLAAEDHKSVEVFALKTGKHLASIGGFDTPHAIVISPDRKSLLVTDSGPEDLKEGYIRIASTASNKITDSIKVPAAADSAGYDPETHLMYADTGGEEAKQETTTIAVIDTNGLKKVNDIKVDSGRVEAIQFEKNGPRMFINMRTKGQVGVLDKKDYKLQKTWDITDAKDNVSMAFDEDDHRLFVATRQPPKLVVFDTESGKEVTSLPSVARADDMFYNKDTKQIYVSGGDGFVGVFQQQDPDHYLQVARVPSGPVAKISLFVPELKRLYVAASAKGAQPAKLLIYDVQ